MNTWKVKPKTWRMCLKCGHIHIPIRVDGLIRWVCIQGKYARIANKHGIDINKPCLPTIEDVLEKARHDGKRCRIDYERLSRDIQTNLSYIPIDHDISFLTETLGSEVLW